MIIIITICLFAHACKIVFGVSTEEDSKAEILQDYYNNKYKH